MNMFATSATHTSSALLSIGSRKLPAPSAPAKKPVFSFLCLPLPTAAMALRPRVRLRSTVAVAGRAAAAGAAATNGRRYNEPRFRAVHWDVGCWNCLGVEAYVFGEAAGAGRVQRFCF